MNNQIQLVLKSSTTELSLNDRELGIYLTPELEGLTGLPEIRTTSGVNAGYDGGWTSAQNYDARSITIRGVIANEDVATVEQLRRQLTTLAGQGKNEELTLDLVTQAGKAYTIQVRTIALEMSLQKVLCQQEFMLQLRADDPLVYDASETTHEALLRVAQATGGFTIDFELPLAITGSSEETIVNNEGLEQVPTVTRMYGELHNPKIINQTTNQFMQIEADLGFAEGEWTTPSEPVEGKNLTINGAPEDAPLSDFKLKGNTEQTTYSGKNLMPYPYDGGGLGNGITFTANSDGSVTLNGKNNNSGNSSYRLQANITFQAGTYYFIVPSNTDVMFSAYDGSRYYDIRSSNNYTLTLSAATTLQYIIIQVARGRTSQFNNYVVHPMMTTISGQTAADYEPYVGGIPAPNPDYPQAAQTVTGENVVKICGKNLFNTHAVVKGRLDNGVIGYASNTTSLTSTDDSITFTVDAAWKGCISEAIPVKPNTEYHMKATSSGATIGASAADYYSEEGWISRKNVPTAALEYNFTTPANCKYVRISWQTSQVGTATISNPQLELGSSATEFEVFSSQSYEVNLGKNLLNIQTTPAPETNISQAGITYTIGEDGAITTSGVSTSTYKNLRFDLTLDAGTYFFSGCPEGGTLDTYSFTVQVGSNLYFDYGSGATFTLSERTTIRAYVIRLGGSAGVNMNGKAFKPMIVKGSTPTSFAPYFAPIELCKIGTYQDYIYKSGGKWYVRKEIGKITFTSTTAWAKHGTTVGNVFMLNNTGFIGYGYGSNAAPAIMDTARVIALGSMPDSANGVFGVNNGSQLRVFRGTYDASYTADTFKAEMVGHYIYGALATPTDTEITNAALIAQLEAILQEAKMYNPQTNITTLYAQGNEQGTLSISYFTDKNPDTRDELIIDSRLRTITLNGLDVYHLQAPGSEFLMLAPGENRLALQSDITGDNGYAQVSYKQGYLSI